MAFYFVSTFAIAQIPTKQPALRLSRTKNLHFAKAPFPGFSAVEGKNKRLNDFFVPLHILSSEQEPDNAFVAIEYQDHWFYIEHSDHSSKQAFGLLTYLYMLQAPQSPSGVPIITIPAG